MLFNNTNSWSYKKLNAKKDNSMYNDKSGFLDIKNHSREYNENPIKLEPIEKK